MNYKLIENHQAVRKEFMKRFLMSYSEFITSSADWISTLRTEFNESYFEKMFMWDRVVSDAGEISFDNALSLLKTKDETESADSRLCIFVA